MPGQTVTDTPSGGDAPIPFDPPERRSWRTLARDTAGETLYRLSVAAASLLPLRAAHATGRALGRLEYRVRGREVQLRPELIRFLGADEEQVASWTRRSCELSVCEDVDYYRYRRARGRGIEQLIELRGLEHLDTVLGRGRGAILYSAHVRGHMTFFSALAARGYQTNLISRHPREHLTGTTLRCYGRCMRNLEERLGLRFIWIRPGNFGVAVQAANALRRNELVILEIDGWSPSALDIDLFGSPALFASGYVTLATATGAPLLDFFVHRENGWRQVGEIGPPFEPYGQPAANVRECVTRIEAHAIRHPEEWYLRP